MTAEELVKQIDIIRQHAGLTRKEFDLNAGMKHKLPDALFRGGGMKFSSTLDYCKVYKSPLYVVKDGKRKQIRTKAELLNHLRDNGGELGKKLFRSPSSFSSKPKNPITPLGVATCYDFLKHEKDCFTHTIIEILKPFGMTLEIDHNDSRRNYGKA
jgi:hypothetical protein